MTQPCTLLIDEIEAIWEAIAARDDWSLFEAKFDDIGQRRGRLHRRDRPTGSQSKEVSGNADKVNALW